MLIYRLGENVLNPWVVWLMDLGPRSATAFYNPLHTPNTHKAHYT